MTAPVAPGRGIGFWLGQGLPPLLIVALLWTDSGARFHFMSAMLLPVVVFSLLSLAWKLLRHRDPARLVRPGLALLLSVGAMAYGKYSLQSAHAAVEAEATRLQAVCAAAGCPDHSRFGDAADDPYGDVPAAPTHLRWRVAYRRVGTGFEMNLPHGPDFSTRWTGGPAQPVQVFNVADGVAVPRPPTPSGEP